MTTDEIQRFITRFEERSLPKGRWTHHAHLLVALWYLTHHAPEQALDLVRQRIRAYNEAVGTPNSDDEGFHETLTRLYMRGVAAHRAAHDSLSLAVSYELLVSSPLGNKAWPLRFYTPERLFSVAARHTWVEPDRPS